MKQGVLLITGTAEAHGTYARSEIRTLLQRSMFTNVSIHHQIRSPWVPASEAATVQHPPRLIPMQETLSALWHNGPTFPPCHRPSLCGEDPLPCTPSIHSPPLPGTHNELLQLGPLPDGRARCTAEPSCGDMGGSSGGSRGALKGRCETGRGEEHFGLS